MSEEVNVSFKGPLFDGVAEEAMVRLAAEAQSEIAKAVEDTWQTFMDAFLNDRIQGLPGLRRWKSRVGGRQRSGGVSGGISPVSPSQDAGW